MADYRHELLRFPKLTPYTSADGLYIALPYGKRVYAWFTYCKSKNICFIVDGHTIYPVHAAFASRLALGTVISGIVLNRVFVAELLLMNAGITVLDKDLTQLNALLSTELDSPIYISTQMKFQMPSHGLMRMFNAPYKIHHVKCGSVLLEEKYAVFTVTALPTSDMYVLSDSGGNACIDSYERSVFMNKLFRCIPENNDIDAGEDSDIESSELGPPLKMECRWHSIHHSWIPIECYIKR